MDWSFNINDLLEIVLIVGTGMAAYWKLSTRVALTEADIRQTHNDILQIKKDLRENDHKIEQKLDVLGTKIDSLIVEVTTLKTKQGG